MSGDQDALRAAADEGVALCTLVGLEGTFSRRIGAQLAVKNGNVLAGNLADACLEKQLVIEAQEAAAPMIRRFGAGSDAIDFRLPCGSGVDVLVDREPDRAAIRDALADLHGRRPAKLDLPVTAEGTIPCRRYIPPLRLLLFGEGPELGALAALCRANGVASEVLGKDDPQRLSLGQTPRDVEADSWTAVVLLFHDHEWEQAILGWALDTPAFYIGAQGGRPTREERLLRLSRAGFDDAALSRVRSPIGLIPHAREPAVLALSVLAEVVEAYETLHPHG